jgi:geranylgeranyl pyrophosphate synthase
MNDRIKIPKPVFTQRYREPIKRIPPTPFERNRILQFVRHYVAEFNPTPPMPLEQVLTHATRIISQLGCNPEWRDYIAVLVNNEMWREILAAVPFERRLLLLPKCLRSSEKCHAEFDEFGLLCRHCGLCSISDLQREAEELGYAVLVAEGSAVVTELIKGGKIDAIIGVSCLNVLEKAFPYMEMSAIPGIAIPLLQDDCKDTTVDLEWVWDYIFLTNSDRTRRLDLTHLRKEVEDWFTPASLELLMGACETETELIARRWLFKAGKRWRPFLTAATYKALSGKISEEIPQFVRKAAVAVECFHKASLIHDDIEDGDSLRYGEKTLHEEYGIAVALNVGDLLIGEGYRLLAECNVSEIQRALMISVASNGHRVLCRGQGDELDWMREPRPMTSGQVLEIFRRKTAPAFEVALKIGAILAGIDAYESVRDVLTKYSEAIGIAYQIKDDLEDFEKEAQDNDLHRLRPNLILATAYDRALNNETKALLESIWHRRLPHGYSFEKIKEIYSELRADERARILMETFKEEAIRSLKPLDNPDLKGLLRRIIGKIFNDVQICGWCREFEERNKIINNGSQG